MARKAEMPRLTGCSNGGYFGWHKWNYSTSWNGNNKSVIPFCDYQTGIARSGYRCYNCGQFKWDQSDLEFALVLAHAWGLIKLPKGPVCEEAATTKETVFGG